MFASIIFRLPAALRRVGAHLKAFALLEDTPCAVPSRPQSIPAGRARSVAARPTGIHHGLPDATPARSHVHRRPPRARADRTPPRRPGAVPERPQTCVTPLPRQPRGPARLPVVRTVRRGSTA
jgi:hypothetical protein